jgi:hypothetical protein
MTYKPDPVAVEQLRALHELGQHVTEAAARARAHMLNDVLATETVLIGASGVAVRDYSVPFGSVVIGNASAAAVTFAPEQGAAAAPASGVGVAIVRPAVFLVHNVAARQLALYGSPGAVVYLAVFAKAQQPLTGPW